MTRAQKSSKIIPMNNFLPCLRKITLTAVLIVVAACAAPYTPPPPLIRADRDDMLEVFSAGYRNITEKYIDVVSTESIAVSGLRGIASIDPAIRIEKQGNEVILTYAGNYVFQTAAPKSSDIVGWSMATLDMIKSAVHVSADMKMASKEKIYEAVFDGVLSGLDIFSRYAGSEEAKRNRARRDGFGGIGIKFTVKNDVVLITTVLPGTPADDANLQSGDQIIEIDGESTNGLSTNNVVSRLHGATQTSVNLKIRRSGDEIPLGFELTRTHIVPNTVTEKRNDGILYFKISSFNQDTARTVAEKLNAAKSDMGHELIGVILDLRGNPGGLLKQSVKVADLFLAQGRIVSTKGRHLDSLHQYEAGGRDLADGLPVFVLIDGKSASAAEIVAAALQDRNRAVLIGTSSYGKGTVQTVIRLPNDGEITLTWSRFMAPSGYPLHGLGVRPVVCTSLNENTVAKIINHAIDSAPQTKATFEAWRIPGLQDKKRRVALRRSCPAEKHKTGLEYAIAQKILSDSAIYEKAQELSTRTSQAQK